jgi:hypothetical protein
LSFRIEFTIFSQGSRIVFLTNIRPEDGHRGTTVEPLLRLRLHGAPPAWPTAISAIMNRRSSKSLRLSAYPGTIRMRSGANDAAFPAR